MTEIMSDAELADLGEECRASRQRNDELEAQMGGGIVLSVLSLDKVEPLFATARHYQARASELEGLLAQAMDLIGMYAFHAPSCVVRAACSCGYTQAYLELQTALAPKEQHVSQEEVDNE